MKFKLNEKLKYALLALANWLLVLYAFLFYRAGAAANISYIPWQIGLAFLNYRLSKGILPLVFLCANLAASTALANYLSMRLYYTRISSDWGTAMVGILIFLVGVGFVISLSSLSIIIRVVRMTTKRKGSQNESVQEE